MPLISHQNTYTLCGRTVKSTETGDVLNRLTSSLFTTNAIADLLKCYDQNANKQSITQVSHFYVHVSCCLNVISSSLNLLTGGNCHVICMGSGDIIRNCVHIVSIKS